MIIDHTGNKERAAGALQSPSVQSAAMWLADNPAIAHPVAAIRERYSLTMAEACEACRLADRFRVLRRAFA